MGIQNLYKNYFQKSKTFLFPVLGIVKGPLTTPLCSYITWDDYITIEDKKLICIYNTTDSRHSLTEQDLLFSNPLFIDFVDNPAENQRAYIFTMENYKQDFELFLKGRYSQLSIQLKQCIIRYFGKKSLEYDYIESFLFPENSFGIYASLLDIPESELRKNGELCNRYDPEKENLKFPYNNLQKST